MPDTYALFKLDLSRLVAISINVIYFQVDRLTS